MEAQTALMAITYGSSRDHREDLKQWMLALATTHDGDVPLFLQPLDGNSSDKVSLLAAVLALQKQLHEADAEPSVYVADNGIYSEANMRQLNASCGEVGESGIGNVHRGENGAARRQSGLAPDRGWQHRVVLPTEGVAARQRALGHRAHSEFRAASTGCVATAGQPCCSELGAQMLASGHAPLCV